MGFRPVISPDARPMPDFCFHTDKIGLKSRWEKEVAKSGI
jgi:hypothetical protein